MKNMLILACAGCAGALLAAPAKLDATGVEVKTFKAGETVFTDRPQFKLTEAAAKHVAGKTFFWTSIGGGLKLKVRTDGELYALAAEPKSPVTRRAELEAAGFARVPGIAPFQVFGTNACDVGELWSKDVKKGEKFQFGKWVIVAGFDPERQGVKPPREGELLYNGIELPKAWPPRDVPADGRSELAVPYLGEGRPAVVFIDVGRQLFVDDFLVEKTDLTRVYNHPVKYEGNPVLKPENDYERNRPQNAIALPKGGGMWWDPEKKVFRLWYEAGWCYRICYAESKDGIHWERPDLGVVPGTNRLLPDQKVDSWSVFPDPEATDPSQRWKLFVMPGGNNVPGYCFTSADGIHWTNKTATGDIGDRTTMFYNPFRRKWIYSLRGGWKDSGRARRYWEGSDFLADCKWEWKDEQSPKWAVRWLRADEHDVQTDRPLENKKAQLYCFDAVAYESIMLGGFEIHWGPENNVCEEHGMPKITEIQFAYSRDGFHWSRPDRRAAIRAERWKSDRWDRGYVQPLSNICVIRDEKLWFYYGAFGGDPTRLRRSGTGPGTGNGSMNGMYDNGAMGCASLRRDGFVGMKATTKGELLTRPVRFSGEHLFVNVDAPAGALRAEGLDEDGEPVSGFSAAESVPVSVDSTKVRLSWKNGATLAAFRGRDVRFRFTLENGTLYSFWVSRRANGASNGYVAGGGPDYDGLVDR